MFFLFCFVLSSLSRERGGSRVPGGGGGGGGGEGGGVAAPSTYSADPRMASSFANAFSKSADGDNIGVAGFAGFSSVAPSFAAQYLPPSFGAQSLPPSFGASSLPRDTSFGGASLHDNVHPGSTPSFPAGGFGSFSGFGGVGGAGFGGVGGGGAIYIYMCVCV